MKEYTFKFTVDEKKFDPVMFSCSEQYLTAMKYHIECVLKEFYVQDVDGRPVKWEARDA